MNNMRYVEKIGLMDAHQIKQFKDQLLDDMYENCIDHRMDVNKSVKQVLSNEDIDLETKIINNFVSDLNIMLVKGKNFQTAKDHFQNILYLADAALSRMHGNSMSTDEKEMFKESSDSAKFLINYMDMNPEDFDTKFISL